MHRIFITILLLLLVVTGGVLFWQWNIYSEKSAELNQNSKANEMIHMEINDHTIKIIHEISGLPAKSYHLVNPKKAKVSCREGEQDCKLSGEQNQMIKTKGGTIQLSYTLRRPIVSAYVLDKWAIELDGVDMTKTRVEITHYGKKTGMWAAGAHLVGQTKKENISYFVFEGTDGVFPLYYQNSPLKQVEADGVTVYGDISNTLLKAAKQYKVKTPCTLIVSNKVSPYSSEHLLIGRSKDKMTQVLANRYYNNNYPFKDKSEKWLQSLIGAYILGERVEGKSKLMIAELSKQLTAEQQAAFVHLLKKNQGNEFSASLLDKWLMEVTGLKTNYFKSNKSEKAKLSTLLFMNNVKWYDKKGNSSDVESITMNSKRYYSLKQIATNLGFQYEIISDNHIYLTNGKTTFRFFPGEKTFLYNETAYSISGELLKKINNKFYISEEYLPKIFSVVVREQDHELQLISLN